MMVPHQSKHNNDGATSEHIQQWWCHIRVRTTMTVPHQSTHNNDGATSEYTQQWWCHIRVCTTMMVPHQSKHSNWNFLKLSQRQDEAVYPSTHTHSSTDIGYIVLTATRGGRPRTRVGPWAGGSSPAHWTHSWWTLRSSTWGWGGRRRPGSPPRLSRRCSQSAPCRPATEGGGEGEGGGVYVT